MEKVHTIDPMEVYGVRDYVEGKTKEIAQHPDFHNPRPVAEQDTHARKSIALTGHPWEPVVLACPQQEPDICIIEDGLTRTYGVADYLRSNLDKIGVFTIAVNWSQATTDDEVRVNQVKLNLDKLRGKALSRAATSKAFRALDKRGTLTDDQLKNMLGLPNNKGGQTTLNKFRALTKVHNKVTDALDSADIEFATAYMLADFAIEDQPKLLKKIIQEKEKGTLERNARQKVGIRKVSHTTLGWAPTIEDLWNGSYMDFVYGQAVAKADPNWMGRPDFAALSHKWGEVTAVFNTYARFLKIEGTPVQQMATIEEYLTDEQRAEVSKLRSQAKLAVQAIQDQAEGKAKPLVGITDPTGAFVA